jgi:CheY-like chemotaxis protein
MPEMDGFEVCRSLKAGETARFKTLAEATFETILIHSEGAIIDVNPAAIRLFQCPESQAHLKGRRIEVPCGYPW